MLARKRTHVAIREIQLNRFRQIECGLNRHLMLRAGSHDDGPGPDVAGIR